MSPTSGDLRVVVAVPAYDEEATVGGVVDAVQEAMPAAAVVVVDDGSADRTAEVAVAHGARVVRHRRNEGVGRAFRTALEVALDDGADVLVTVDADGQFDPAQIPELVAPIVEGRADLVTGNRFRGRPRRPAGMPLAKYWGNLWMARLLRVLCGVRLGDVSCGFRAYSREALLHLNLFGTFTYTQETILDLSFKGLRVEEVAVRVRYFPGRRSRVAGNLVRYALQSLAIVARTTRDYRPLRFFGALAAVLVALGTAALGFLLHHYLSTGALTPYKVLGFVGGGLDLAGILVAGVGLLADMFDRIRLNQERLLYLHKRHLYGPGGRAPRGGTLSFPDSGPASRR